MHTYIQFHIPGLWEALEDKRLLKIANQSKWKNFSKKFYLNLFMWRLPAYQKWKLGNA